MEGWKDGWMRGQNYFSCLQPRESQPSLCVRPGRKLKQNWKRNSQQQRSDDGTTAALLTDCVAFAHLMVDRCVGEDRSDVDLSVQVCLMGFRGTSVA